jgi:hypothetical protein
MDITYSFKITNMYCYPTYGSVTNLVFTILWEYTGTDGANSSYITNRTDIPYDPNAEYKPYNELSEEEVIGWIEQYTDSKIIDDAKTLIEHRITEASSPPSVINPKLPWDFA